MLFTRAECVQRFGSDYLVKKQIKSGNLFYIEKGIYSDQPHVPEQAIIAFKYPNSILTMTSAFYRHGLTDIIPDYFDLATDRDASKIKDSRVRQYFMPHGFFENGAITFEEKGCSYQIYSRERMLIELLRNKSSIPFDMYKEILQNYRKIIDSLNMQEIQDYVFASPKSNMIMNALQTEVL